MLYPFLRWGIIGPGKISEQFAQAVQESEHAMLQAVASRELSKAQTFASRFKVPHAYGGYAELLADDLVDAVYIATPHPFHAEWAVKSAQAGKHILCEKPVAMNHRETISILDAARAHDVFFMEAFMYRCHPQTQHIVDWVQSGAIGQVRMIFAHFGFNCGNDTRNRLLAKELGGGGILDVGCYPMSFARLIAGAAEGRPFCNPDTIKAVGTLHPETGTDIWTTASLQFPSGISAQATCSLQAMIGSGARIIGSEGIIEVDSPFFCNGSVILQQFGGRRPKQTKKKFRHKQHLYRHEIEAVAAHLSHRQVPSPAMSWDDTLGNMQALDRWRAEIGLRFDADE